MPTGSGATRFDAGTPGRTQSKGDGIYAGKANTSIIIAAQVAIGDDGGTYAARICNELQITEDGVTYGDWYLPSRYELILMFQERMTISTTAVANGGAGLADDWYWSSTEGGGGTAWLRHFQANTELNITTASPENVRGVRAF